MRTPLVSCVMPTWNRRPFVPRAIGYFLRQDYPARELVVVDDGTDPVADLMPADPRVQYVRLTGRRSIGAKRNLAVRRAKGELVVLWDDDDWMAPWRLSYQVAAFAGQRAEVSGLRALLYLDLATGDGWRFAYPRRQRPGWVATPTFCFRRELALARPFPDLNVGSGTRWLRAWPPLRLGVLADPAFYVATIHPGNAAVKDTRNAWWRPYPRREIAALLGDDWPLPRPPSAARPGDGGGAAGP